MKYYRLHIDTDGTLEMYNNITLLLEIEPMKVDLENDSNPYVLWTYSIDEGEQDEYYDFINNFLDILEPKFANLEKLGVTRDKILFWMLYEYDQQCGMEFHPQEMMRLGQNGIHLNIDCWQKTTN